MPKTKDGLVPLPEHVTVTLLRVLPGYCFKRTDSVKRVGYWEKCAAKTAARSASIQR
jgi:hypothetical protein